ncbi:MAG: nuclear transport factor 2 family protein [Reyranella sp.]|uniref:nuclear transport factor 2 family protein n=1 Tax=Reyranella sp. TaxID=1929291 RepID=UPI003D096DC5
MAAGLAVWSSGAMAQTADAAALLKTLMALEKESWQYVKDKNIAGMKDYMADDGLQIFGDGSRYDKTQFLKFMPDFRLDSITYDSAGEIKVWTPDVVTLLYRVTYSSGVKGGKATTYKVMSANTYVRRGGKWWSVLYQESPVP